MVGESDRAKPLKGGFLSPKQSHKRCGEASGDENRLARTQWFMTETLPLSHPSLFLGELREEGGRERALELHWTSFP